MFGLNLVIVAVAHPGGFWLTLLTVYYGLSQLKSVPSIGYLHGQGTTLMRRGESEIEVFNCNMATVS